MDISSPSWRKYPSHDYYIWKNGCYFMRPLERVGKIKSVSSCTNLNSFFLFEEISDIWQSSPQVPQQQNTNSLGVWTVKKICDFELSCEREENRISLGFSKREERKKDIWLERKRQTLILEIRATLTPWLRTPHEIESIFQHLAIMTWAVSVLRWRYLPLVQLSSRPLFVTADLCVNLSFFSRLYDLWVTTDILWTSEEALVLQLKT